MYDEILAGPLTLWKAPVGTEFPALGSEPSGSWTLIGKSAPENYTDDGVSVNLPQTIEEFTGAGSTIALKAFRTEEAVEIVVTVADTRAELLKPALNENTVTEGTGDVEIGLLRGPKVAEVAVLARGASPYEDNGSGQFQIPRCYQSGEPELVHQKGEPVGVELTWRALRPAPESLADFKAIFSSGNGD